MSSRLHPFVSSYLTELFSEDTKATVRLAAIRATIRERLGPLIDSTSELIMELNKWMGSEIRSTENYYCPAYLAEEASQTPFHKKFIGLREKLLSNYELKFPNTYQCCAFVLLTAFPTDDADELLDKLTPRVLFFEPSESYDEDGDLGYSYTDKITTRLMVDWCPHSMLTDDDLLTQVLESDSQTYFYPFEETNTHALFQYFADSPIAEIPPALLSEHYTDEIELKHLIDFENLRGWVEQKIIDRILRMTGSAYELSELLSKISPTAARYEEAVRKALSLDGMLLKKLEAEYGDREDLVRLAIEQNGQALAHASPRLQQRIELISRAIKNTPLSILFLPEDIQQDPSWIGLALEGMPALLDRLNMDLLDEQTRLECYKQAIQALPIAIQLIPEGVRTKHPELFRLALEQDKRTMIFATPSDTVLDPLLQDALLETPLLFQYLSEKERGSEQLLRLVIKKEPLLYKYVPAEQKSNPTLAMAALEENPYALVEVQQHFAPPSTFIEQTIELDPFIMEPEFLTRHYSHVPRICEQYLGAVLGKKNSALEAIEKERMAFRDREMDLHTQLFIKPVAFHGYYDDLPF